MKHAIFLLFVLVSMTVVAAKSRPQRVRIETTAGTIVVELSDETPKHRDNFVKLCKEGYYDSTLFHRVIKDFMIQGGDPDSRVRTVNGTTVSPSRDKVLGDGDPGYTIEAEFNLPWLYHVRGALAAAREGDDVNPEMRSSGSQFYIVWGRSWGEGSLGKQRGALAEKGIEMTYDMWNDYLQYGGAPHLVAQSEVLGERTFPGRRIHGVGEDHRVLPRLDVFELSECRHWEPANL